MTKSICDMACEILQKTNDGNDLAPHHLYLLQIAVNGQVTEAGEVKFYELHKSVMDGYKKPWFHGIENLTQDHEGYIYWKGQHVEHYSFRDYDREQKAAEELAEACRIIEGRGETPSFSKVMQVWDDRR